MLSSADTISSVAINQEKQHDMENKGWYWQESIVEDNYRDSHQRY
jgi:hypothetical protein